MDTELIIPIDYFHYSNKFYLYFDLEAPGCQDVS